MWPIRAEHLVGHGLPSPRAGRLTLVRTHVPSRAPRARSRHRRQPADRRQRRPRRPRPPPLPLDPAAAAAAVKKPAKGDKLRGVRARQARRGRRRGHARPSPSWSSRAAARSPRRATRSAASAAPSATPPTSSATSAPSCRPTRSSRRGAAVASRRSTSTRSCRCPRSRPDQPGPKQPAGHRRPRRGHGGRQPVHADPRDRLGRLQAPAPDLGRPRHHHRHPGQRHRPGAPRAADDVHGRAQDRRHVHRHRPGHRGLARHRRRRHLAAHEPSRPPARPSVIGNATYTVPAGTFQAQQLVESRTNIAGGEVLGDVNRDGDTTDRIGVLLDTKTNEVIVDSDDDKDFTDEKRMRPVPRALRPGRARQGRRRPPASSRPCPSPWTCAAT